MAYTSAMFFAASDAIDFSDPQAAIAWLNNQLALRDRLLPEKDTLLASNDAEISARNEKLSSRDQQIEHLKLLLEKMRRDAYGTTSEKLERSVDQLELKLEKVESDRRQTRSLSNLPPPSRSSFGVKLSPIGPGILVSVAMHAGAPS